jgi:hypothetical protein
VNEPGISKVTASTGLSPVAAIVSNGLARDPILKPTAPQVPPAPPFPNIPLCNAPKPVDTPAPSKNLQPKTTAKVLHTPERFQALDFKPWLESDIVSQPPKIQAAKNVLSPPGPCAPGGLSGPSAPSHLQPQKVGPFPTVPLPNPPIPTAKSLTKRMCHLTCRLLCSTPFVFQYFPDIFATKSVNCSTKNVIFVLAKNSPIPMLPFPYPANNNDISSHSRRDVHQSKTRAATIEYQGRNS